MNLYLQCTNTADISSAGVPNINNISTNQWYCQNDVLHCRNSMLFNSQKL